MAGEDFSKDGAISGDCLDGSVRPSVHASVESIRIHILHITPGAIASDWQFAENTEPINLPSDPAHAYMAVHSPLRG